jgi:hypothetical protein
MTDEQCWEFSDYIHDLKDSGYKGSGKNGDFTYNELNQLARQFLNEDTEPDG